MQELGKDGQSCPFAFNFDAQTFKVGDIVSYRIPERFGDFPFVGSLTAVFDDHVEISPDDPTTPDKRVKGTREARPIVRASEIL
jgi:hypothetical protein